MEEKLAWLEDPRVFQVNRLPAHSDHKYTIHEKGKPETENCTQSLNGIWRFYWSESPQKRPRDFYKEGFQEDGFKPIQVPGHIELQGYDKIHYTNTMYPWEGHRELRPPHVDHEYNPVGSYCKEFILQEEFNGKRVCISFQGVEQAFYVWLNGQFVGYGEDSFTPTDFDLTEYIRRGSNRICVEVYKRSSAAWIEDQDFFRFSGIFRDVFLYAKPAYHVEDLWVIADLQEEYRTGVLKVRAKISKACGIHTLLLTELDQGIKIEFEVLNQDGKVISGKRNEEVSHQYWLEDGYFCFTERTIDKVYTWCSESPYLYELKLYIESENERIESVSCKIGFRRFEIKNNLMCLNGKPLTIYGVNWHEWHPSKGRAISYEDMVADIKIIKKNHINAVRTSHYPNQSRWYELCDEHGIYLMDETNLESHGSWQKMGKCDPTWNVPGNLPEWEACVVDRARSMLPRDKNHASILWWSCGNESYAGKDILAMSEFFHTMDSTRLVHYEGVFWNRAYSESSDIESRMYATPEEIIEYLESENPKPFLLCEYMHNMGNSFGGMESYINLMERYPLFQADSYGILSIRPFIGRTVMVPWYWGMEEILMTGQQIIIFLAMDWYLLREKKSRQCRNYVFGTWEKRKGINSYLKIKYVKRNVNVLFRQ